MQVILENRIRIGLEKRYIFRFFLNFWVSPKVVALHWWRRARLLAGCFLYCAGTVCRRSEWLARRRDARSRRSPLSALQPNRRPREARLPERKTSRYRDADLWWGLHYLYPSKLVNNNWIVTGQFPIVSC